MNALASSMNVGNFVSVKPSLEEGKTKDFNIWKEQMLCLLESQDVAGLVDDNVDPPIKDESEVYKDWQRRDRLVKGWILGSIGMDVLAAVWNAPTARDVWIQLNCIFESMARPEDRFDHGWRGKFYFNLEVTSSDKKTCKTGSQAKSLTQCMTVTGEVDSFDKHPSMDQLLDEGTDSRGIFLTSNLVLLKEQEREDYGRYSAVYRAAQVGDWDTAQNFFQDINQLSSRFITPDFETALHVAILAGGSKDNGFVRRAVEAASASALALQDSAGRTALHNAAVVGNTAAARDLVRRNPSLLYIECHNGGLAVHEAAKNCQRATLEYLMFEHESDAERRPMFFEGQHSIRLLNEIIASQYFDVALYLVHKYPKLSIDEEGGTSALPILIASTYNLFQIRDTFTWWQNFIYHRIPVKRRSEFDTTSFAPDIENLSSDGAMRSSFQMFSGVGQKEAMIWNVLEYSVPMVKFVKLRKTEHEEALQLAQYLCNQVSKMPEREASKIFKKSIMEAAHNGVAEIAEMIIEKQPSVIHHGDPITGMNIFMVAARYRYHNFFNLIYHMSDRISTLFDATDNDKNNLLHVCGKLAPPHRLNLVAGAALQMQREILWFKEMEKFVYPSRRTWVNKKGKTPQVVFTEEHEELRGEAERWIKESSNACTIAATLIATVMFAAAFTVPGVPLFAAFNIFVVSDTISLFTSIASLLAFLSILTSSWYAVEDFLYLRNRLSVGMLNLFVSIAFMLLAFSATLYLVPYAKLNYAWYVILVGTFGCLPTASFVLVQLPLLLDFFRENYGFGIFGKRSKRVLY